MFSTSQRLLCGWAEGHVIKLINYNQELGRNACKQFLDHVIRLLKFKNEASGAFCLFFK